MIWCLFGCGFEDDDALALGGDSFVICGGLVWHLMVILLLFDW
jgi:hypothetical protein